MSIGNSVNSLKSSMAEIEMRKDELLQEHFIAKFQQRKETIKLQKNETQVRIKHMTNDLNLHRETEARHKEEQLRQHVLNQAKLDAESDHCKAELRLREMEIEHADRHRTQEFEMHHLELLNEQKRLDIEWAKMQKHSTV